MAIYHKKKGIEDENNNIFWTTMSDLLLGLAIIFMTLFVLAMTGFTQDKVQLQQTQMKAAEEMAQKLKDADIDAEVDKVTGSVKKLHTFTKRQTVFGQIRSDLYKFNPRQ